MPPQVVWELASPSCTLLHYASTCRAGCVVSGATLLTFRALYRSSGSGTQPAGFSNDPSAEPSSDSGKGKRKKPTPNLDAIDDPAWSAGNSAAWPRTGPLLLSRGTFPMSHMRQA